MQATGATPLASPASPSSAARSELQTPWGIIICGSLHGDVVIASAEALALVKAGLLVRALVLGGLEKLKRTVSIGGGKILSLDHGIYRITRS